VEHRSALAAVAEYGTGARRFRFVSRFLPVPIVLLLLAHISPSAAATAPKLRPRVVPRGPSDADLLEALDWRLYGFPAISKDRRYVATVFAPSIGSRAILSAAHPNVDEPDGVDDYPNYVFVRIDAKTGALVQRTPLVDDGEFDAAQRNKSESALAATVRKRLRETDRALARGGYEQMQSVRFDGKSSLRLEGETIRLENWRLAILDDTGRRRLNVSIRKWAGPPLPIDPTFTCTYTPHVEQVAIDKTKSVALVTVAQNTNGGDACAGAVNGNRKLRLLQLAP
jgi:hypothetical protein